MVDLEGKKLQKKYVQLYDFLYSTIWFVLNDWNWLKLSCHKKVFYFALNFLPWEFSLIKKLDFEKTKVTLYMEVSIETSTPNI